MEIGELAEPFSNIGFKTTRSPCPSTRNKDMPSPKKSGEKPGLVGRFAGLELFTHIHERKEHLVRPIKVELRVQLR